MVNSPPMKTILPLTMVWLVTMTSLWANEPVDPAGARYAALALPFGERADWRQWDSFLTFAVKRLGQDMSAEKRDEIAEVFLDARYDLVQAINSGSSDPVPRLFLDTWERLSPIIKQSIPGATQQSAAQFTSFATAMDGMTALSGITQLFGLFRISPDALRGAARLLGPSAVDPLEYVMDVDNGLRAFLGFTGSLPAFRLPANLEQSRLRVPSPQDRAAAASSNSWFVRRAFAAPADRDSLDEWVPDIREPEPYLERVRDLLVETYGNVLSKSKLAKEHHGLYRHILLTTAWQESCWRQYVKKGEKLTPLSSATGDVGIMQINRNVWRGVYDVKGLSGDIEYNGNAGGEIALHYLTRYAIRKGEDKQPGGHLARATYAAYNGGPRHLTRYRAAKQNPHLKRVDEAFWDKFQAVSSGEELAVRRCYGR